MLLIYFLAVVAMASLHAMPAPHGLRVRLVRANVKRPEIIGMQPIIIEVRRAPVSRSHEALTTICMRVNGRVIGINDLEVVLQNEMKVRPPDWPVYLEADSDLEWRSVVEAIDMMRKCHARVVLLTRRTATTTRNP